MPNDKINRTWVKENTHPSFVLVVRGEEFLTVIAALSYEMHSGPGALMQRHARKARSRIVGELPMGKPEIVLHRTELLALIDGLEALRCIEDHGGPSQSVLDQIETGVWAHIKARSRSNATA